MEIKNFINSLQIRNQNIPQPLKDLKSELENSFEKNILEAGVITPGYFSYFTPILEKYKIGKVISRYHISEEQHSNGFSGKILKIPIVDVFTDDLSTRLFIIPNSFLNKL